MKAIDSSISINEHWLSSVRAQGRFAAIAVSIFAQATVFFVISLVSVQNASGIAYGIPDCVDASGQPVICSDPTVVSSKHPNIGSLIVFRTDGGRHLCTTELVDYMKPDAAGQGGRAVFLTARHCVRTVADTGVSLDAYYGGLSTLVRGGRVVLRPGGIDRGWAAQGVPEDQALVVFEGTQVFENRWGSIQGALTPLRLPTVGLLDELKQLYNPAPQNLRFSAVGYGTGEFINEPGDGGTAGGPSANQNRTPFRNRNIGDSAYRALEPGILTTSINPAQELSGASYGDSGGPILYNDPNQGEVLVATVGSGDYWIRATNTSPRADSTDAVKFLSSAAVPGTVYDIQNDVCAKFELNPCPQPQ